MLGGLWLTGGLATAPPQVPAPTTGLRKASVGEPVDVGPATITVNRVVALDDLGEIVGPPDEGYRFIAISASVEVTDRRTWDRLDASIRIGGVAGLQETDSGEARLVDSSQRADSLQPGLPVDVGVVFQQRQSSAVPGVVTVTIYCWQRTGDEFGDWYWLDNRPCAQITVDTEDRTTAAATSPSPTPGPSQ
jgi:hypothetical protein